MRRSRIINRAILTLAMLTLLTGCIERRIKITTEPPGARVWFNDVELGASPVVTAFTFYGDYDVRVELDGYERISTFRKAKAPIHEWPGVDLVATALPTRIENEIHWHFELEPELESVLDAEQLERDMVERSDELRSMLDGE